MEIDYNELFNILSLIRSEHDSSFRLGFRDQRELLLWFKNNKPELVREIFCEDCPEHMEYLDYYENKVERGK